MFVCPFLQQMAQRHLRHCVTLRASSSLTMMMMMMMMMMSWRVKFHHRETLSCYFHHRVSNQIRSVSDAWRLFLCCRVCVCVCVFVCVCDRDVVSETHHKITNTKNVASLQQNVSSQCFLQTQRKFLYQITCKKIFIYSSGFVCWFHT